MSGGTVSIEFLGSNDLERVKKARQLAAEAEAMAAAVISRAMREDYLRLKRELTALADQIEQTTSSNDVVSHQLEFNTRELKA